MNNRFDRRKRIPLIYCKQDIKKSIKKNEIVYMVSSLEKLYALKLCKKFATTVDLNKCIDKQTLEKTLRYYKGAKIYLVIDKEDKKYGTEILSIGEKKSIAIFSDIIYDLASEIGLLDLTEYSSKNPNFKKYPTIQQFFGIYYLENKKQAEQEWKTFINDTAIIVKQ